MATTATTVTKQLAQTQTDTATPNLEQRKLARFLESAIHYHYKKEFFDQLEKGADINFRGLDDKNQPRVPSIIDAILYNNIYAFDELLKRKADINRGTTLPLFEAAARGNAYMVKELLRQGADPLAYKKGTCLTLMLESIHTSALLEPKLESQPRFRTRWRYENESPDTDNAVLKQQISDFYSQENAYTPPKPHHIIPFVAPEQVIHVHFYGHLEILGTLLSRNVSPVLPVEGTARSALALVQNPTKFYNHFRSEPKEQLEYLRTEAENPSVLLFAMTLVNKRNTGTTPMKIVVHYDFSPSRKLVESAVAHLNPQVLAVTQSLSYGMQEAGNKLNVQWQSQLAVVHEKLSDMRSEAAQFTQEVKAVKEAVHYDERQEIASFISYISGHPNAEEAYKSFKIGLEAIHTSALAVKGGGVTVSEGPLSLVASVLDMSTELVDMIPIVGSAASKLFGLASTVTKEMDKAKQTNLFENIASMATSKEARKTFERVARKLTMAYFEQFERLATKQFVQAQLSSPQKFLQNAKGKTLNSRFISPAERVTAFAIIWMIDEVFNNVHTLDQELAAKGLEAILLNVVTQRKPAERLTTFWHEITSKLGVNEIPTQSTGETWSPADFWTAPGVKVQNSSDFQYFTYAHTNTVKFGWRLGTFEDVQILGLNPATNVTLLPQQPLGTFNRISPIPIVSTYLGMPKSTSLNVDTANNAMLLKPPPYEAATTPNSPSSGKSNSSSMPVASDIKQGDSVSSKRSKSPFARLKAAYSK